LKAEMKKNLLLSHYHLFFLIFFLPGIIVHSQSLPSWLKLEQGKMFFRDGTYGQALMAFEDARRLRFDEFSRMESDLILTLSKPDLRRLGDTLDMVERYCIDYHQDTAVRALKELYYRYPKEGLGGSVRRALEELGRLKSYPEAEFWLGETYRVEGELNLALKQYQKAYEYRKNLDTPGFEVEILYKMMEIHRIKQDYPEMERLAQEILKDQGVNNQWVTQSSSRAAMTRVLENNGISRFLTIYRYNNTQMERAYRLLGFYYYATSRHELSAEYLMFSFLIQSTLVIEEVIRRQHDFTFTTLDTLMDAIQRRRDLLDYLEDTEYYRTLYYLGAALNATGKRDTAQEFWTFLSGREEAGIWRARARSQLQNPFVERAIQMP